MTLTKEQLKMIGDSYLDDMPFRYEDVDQSLLWNSLPTDIQCEGINYGANESCVRELVEDHLLKTQLDISYDEWYDTDSDGIHTHEVAEALFSKSLETVWIDIDYKKL